MKEFTVKKIQATLQLLEELQVFVPANAKEDHPLNVAIAALQARIDTFVQNDPDNNFNVLIAITHDLRQLFKLEQSSAKIIKILSELHILTDTMADDLQPAIVPRLINHEQQFNIDRKKPLADCLVSLDASLLSLQRLKNETQNLLKIRALQDKYKLELQDIWLAVRQVNLLRDFKEQYLEFKKLSHGTHEQKVPQLAVARAKITEIDDYDVQASKIHELEQKSESPNPANSRRRAGSWFFEYKSEPKPRARTLSFTGFFEHSKESELAILQAKKMQLYKELIEPFALMSVLLDGEIVPDRTPNASPTFR